MLTESQIGAEGKVELVIRAQSERCGVFNVSDGLAIAGRRFKDSGLCAFPIDDSVDAEGEIGGVHDRSVGQSGNFDVRLSIDKFESHNAAGKSF